MSLFKSLFSKRNQRVIAREIETLCANNADALAAFEAAYAATGAHITTNQVIGGIDKRTIDELALTATGPTTADITPELHRLCEDIAHALAQVTPIIEIDDVENGLGVHHTHITQLDQAYIDELTARAMAFPENTRPLCTVEAAVCDVNASSDQTLLEAVAHIAHAQSEREARMWYHLFRQGLDMLDIEPILYGMLCRNITSIEHWAPKLANAIRATHTPFDVPHTRIALVPPTLLQMTRIDYLRLTPATKLIANLWAHEVFGTATDDDLFIRTGCASSKFDFRNAHVYGPELTDLGEYLLYIHHQQSQMVSPLNNMSVYGMATSAAWAVRDYIAPTHDFGAIYHGMPLRAELRVFVDCDTDTVIATSPYWRRDIMQKRFAELRDEHDLHDGVTFAAHINALDELFAKHTPAIETAVAQLLPALDLTGTWSLDVMIENDTFYAIDMAPAALSALSDVCPAYTLKPAPEPWLPAWPVSAYLEA